MSEDMQIHFEYKTLQFVGATSSNKGLAYMDGELSTIGVDGFFQLALAPTTGGEWTLQGAQYANEIAMILAGTIWLRSVFPFENFTDSRGYRD